MSLLFNPTIKRAVSGRIDTLLMCASTPPPPQRWMTTTGPTHHHHHQEKKTVIVTARSKLDLLLRCVKPAPAATVSPRGLQTYRRVQPLALSKVENPPYYDGRTLLTAQEQAIQRWELPRRPEYGTPARRAATFYQKEAPWNPEGKPSVGSIAAAGFYYDGEFTFNIIKMLNFKFPALI